MSRISLGGLVSGMDTDTVVAKLMQLEAAKVSLQEKRRSELTSKQNTWRDVQSRLSTLKSKLDALRTESTFGVRKLSGTDDTVATATAAAGSTLTTHVLEVTQLAQTHVVASKNYTNANTAVGAAGAGTLKIGTADIVITETDTLNSIRDKIRAQSGSNVTADVVTVMEGTEEKARLVLTAKNSGTANAIVMSDTLGTASQELGFKDGSGYLPSQVLASAKDATFKLNGISYTRATNEISDIVPGLTFSLKKNGTTNITLTQDAEKVADGVKAWVDALNESLTFLKDQTKYDAGAKTGGKLSGDPLAKRLLSNLRAFVSRELDGLDPALNKMSQVGVTTGAWNTADYGKVLLDRDKLIQRLKDDPNGVAVLFGAVRTNLALTAGGATASASSPAPGDNVYGAEGAFNGDSTATRFGSAGGGWQSTGVPSTGSPEWLQVTFKDGVAQQIDRIILTIPDNPPTYVAGNTGLKDYRLEYQKEDLSWAVIESVTNHSGPAKVFEFDQISALAVRITVTGTYGTNNPARISELRVDRVNNGTAADMYRYVAGTLASDTGSVELRNKTLSDQVKRVGDTITKMNEKLAEKEERLRAQFTRMEAALAKIQGQGNSLAMLSLNNNRR